MAGMAPCPGASRMQAKVGEASRRGYHAILPLACRANRTSLVFCCVGMRAILGRLGRAAALPGNAPDRDATLCEWLALRQLPCGGLNGRPEKLEDVCYSWWVLSSITLLGRLHWIDSEALVRFILSCQVRACLSRGRPAPSSAPNHSRTRHYLTP